MYTFGFCWSWWPKTSVNAGGCLPKLPRPRGRGIVGKAVPFAAPAASAAFCSSYAVGMAEETEPEHLKRHASGDSHLRCARCKCLDRDGDKKPKRMICVNPKFKTQCWLFGSRHHTVSHLGGFTCQLLYPDEYMIYLLMSYHAYTVHGFDIGLVYTYYFIFCPYIDQICSCMFLQVFPTALSQIIYLYCFFFGCFFTLESLRTNMFFFHAFCRIKSYKFILPSNSWFLFTGLDMKFF